MLYLPFDGEFGWRILLHMRTVAMDQDSDVVVACAESEKVLYPNATEFFTDFNYPFLDSERQHLGGSNRARREAWSERAKLRESIRSRFPNLKAFDERYDCHWHLSDLVKPKLVVPSELKPVHVVFAPRFRTFCPERNWQHWNWFISTLHKFKLTCGAVGQRETSEIGERCDVYAWDHSLGDLVGTIDLLLNCSLYVGTDSGVSHLAALMNIPSVIFRKDSSHDHTGVMIRANFSEVTLLGSAGWDHRDLVLGALLRRLVEKL